MRHQALSPLRLKSRSRGAGHREGAAAHQHDALSAEGAGCGGVTPTDPGLALEKDHLGTALEMEEHGISFLESSEAPAGRLLNPFGLTKIAKVSEFYLYLKMRINKLHRKFWHLKCVLHQSFCFP